MNLRRIAAQTLVRVIEDGQSLTPALDVALRKLDNSHDKAFVQALCFGVIRHYFALDFQLGHLLDKPLKDKDADIKMLLLLGLFQLQQMRVKPHAAVSETVAATKNKPWAKGLINGVLRRYQREQLTLDGLIDTDLQAHHNHPRWLIEQIEQNWPEQADSILAANNAAPPMTLRVNLRRGNRDTYLSTLADEVINAHLDPICETALGLEQPLSVEKLPGFAEGLVSVQDSAAQLAAMLVDAQPGDRVLDICAAPGGKTAAILERQPAVHSLLAIDIDPERLKRIDDNLQRLQLTAKTRVADASLLDANSVGHFDRILLDAPCCGLGVIRRHPDIKLLRRESDIAPLVALQAKILDNAWALLSPGGFLLYATCSILKQENEQQIAAFFARHVDAIELTLPGDWGIARPFGRQILTGTNGMDGFYYAKLQKVG